MFTGSLKLIVMLVPGATLVALLFGTVLLICGEADTLWPSCPMAEQVKARADAAGGPTVTILSYDHAAHGVFGVPVPKSNPNYGNLDTFGGTDDANNAARMDAWPKVLVHLEAALR